MVKHKTSIGISTITNTPIALLTLLLSPTPHHSLTPLPKHHPHHHPLPLTTLSSSSSLTPEPSPTPHTNPILQRLSTPTSSQPQPILVLGATGRIGRRVVRRLLNENISVRAFCRDYETALEVLSPEENGGMAMAYARRRDEDAAATLEIVIGDLAPDDDAERAYDYWSSSEKDAVDDDLGYEALESAIRGCGGVISCQGTVRRSSRRDFFPPWRLFRHDVSRWCRDRSHPYYVNYLATKRLVKFVEEEQERQRREEMEEEEERGMEGRREGGEEETRKKKMLTIVRISDLCVSLVAWDFVVVVTNIMLSMIFRYQSLTEKILRESNVRTVILRPGDLIDDERDASTTSLDVSPTGKLPPPSIVGRDDVAALAIAALRSSSPQNHTLAVRWVGDAIPSTSSDGRRQRQGWKEDGYKTAGECLAMVEKFTVPSLSGRRRVKPYGLFAGLGFYGTLMVLGRVLVWPALEVVKVGAVLRWSVGAFGRVVRERLRMLSFFNRGGGKLVHEL